MSQNTTPSTASSESRSNRESEYTKHCLTTDLEYHKTVLLDADWLASPNLFDAYSLTAFLAVPPFSSD